MADWQPTRHAESHISIPQIKRWIREAAGLVRLHEPATKTWRRSRRFLLKLLS